MNGEEPRQPPDRVSTGLTGLDEVLDDLRIGDNVVWRVSHLDDYRRFVLPFVDAAADSGRQILYLRFGEHPPIIENHPAVRTIKIDALGGFESITSRVWHLIEQHGRGAFYVCDSLSELLNAWATDAMVGNFFRVVCPRSEEHTSELQSRPHLVCRLLLEKKKKKRIKYMSLC